MHATQLWSAWQALALDFAAGFTPRGRRRFVEWVTGLALNVEEHTLTQSLVGLDRPQDGRALESFAEYGSWYLPSLEWNAAWRIDRLPGRLWHGYRVWAGDDTKVHRNSPGVWGTCTFHEHSARCPNRAGTVRAHNWVVVGALLPGTDEPALFLPVAGRLYFRQGQLPAGEPFRTKCQLLVELLRWRADPTNGPALAVFDGGFALRSVVRPLVLPDDPRQPRVEFVTRLRHDARLHARPPQARRPGQRGPQPRWGKRLPPPRQGGRWPGGWQIGEVFLYGRRRSVRWQEVVCLWRLLRHGVPVKGRLGWVECRAWTKNPVVRTTQALFVTLTLLRLLQRRLQEREGEDWWLHPPWDRHKARPSVLDVERLLRQHRGAIQRLLSDWLESEGQAGKAVR